MMIAHEYECIRDYGVPATVAGARQWARVTAPREPMRYGQYVRICERMLTRAGREIPHSDIIGAGWQYESPTRWILEGGLERFIAYWERAAERPHRPGSSYNLVYPAEAYRQMRAGIPASIVRAMGAVIRIPPDAPIPRVSRRTVRTLAWAARAARRKSIRALGTGLGAHIFSSKALAALGRLDAEDQARLVEAIQRDPRWPSYDLPLEQRALAWGAWTRAPGDAWDQGPFVRRIRVRDIPWEIIR